MASETTLGKLIVRLMMDTDDFNEKTKTAKGDIDQLGSMIEGWGDALDSLVTGALAAAAGGMAAFAALSAKTGADFEYALTRVVATADDGAQNIAALEAQARKLGKTTAFSATEVAGAMNALAQAGLKSQDIIDAASSAVNLAGATGSTMDDSANLIAATLSQFQLQAGDATRVVDVFSQAMNATLFDMDSLSLSMRYAGVVGAGFGYTLEETTAALSQFRNLGLEGSKAGTTFRGMMAAAANVTADGAKVLKTYNLELQDISPGMHGFAEIMETLGKAGITTTDAMKVFGQEVGGTVAAVAGQFAAGSTTFYSTLDALQNSTGATSEMYGKMTDTVLGQFDNVTGGIEEMFLSVYDKYAEPLKSFLTTLADTIQYVSDTFNRNNADMGEGFDSVFATMEAWLVANKQALAVFFQSVVQGMQTVMRIAVALAPYLDDLAKILLTIFIARQVYAFVAAVQVAVAAVRALSVAFTEAAAAGTVATGGLLPVAAAVAAAVVAIGAFAFSMANAEGAAETLAAAESKVTEEVNRQKAAMQSATDAALAATQKRLRAYLDEHKALGDLSETEIRRIESALSMSGAQAQQAIEAGKMVTINGELYETQALIEEQGNDGIALIDQQIAAYKKQATGHGDALARMQQSMENYTGAQAANISEGGAFRSYLSQYGDSIEEIRLKMESLATAQGEAASKAKALGDTASAVTARIIQAETAGAAREGEKRKTDAAKVSDDIVKKRRSAAEASRKIEEDLTRQLAKLGESRVQKVAAQLADRLADVNKAFADELALYTAGSAAYLAVDARRAAAQASARALTAAQVVADQQKLVGAETDARAQLYATEDMRLADAADKRRAVITDAFDAEAQLYEAGSAQALEVEQRKLDALAAVTNTYLAQREEAERAATDQRLATIKGMETGEARQRANVLEAIEMDRLAAQEAMTGASAEERARVDAVFARRTADAQMELSRKVEAVVAGLDSRGVRRSVALERERLATIEALNGASAEEIASVNEAYAKATSDARKEESKETWGKVAKAGKDAAKVIGDAFKAIGSVLSTVGNTAMSVFKSITGFSFDLVDAVTELADAQADAEEKGGSFDAETAAEDLVTGLVEGASRMIQMFVSAAPTLIRSLAEQLPVLIAELANALPGLVQELATQLPTLMQGIVDALPLLIDAVIDAIPVIIEAMEESLPILVDGIIDAIPRIVQALLDSLPSVIAMVADAVTALIAAIPDIIKQILDALPTIITALLESLDDIIVAILQAIPDIIAAIIDALPDIIMALLNGILSILVTVAEQLPMLIAKIIEMIPDLLNAILGMIPDIITALLDAIPDIIMGLVQGIPDIIQALLGSIPDITAGIVMALPQIITALIVGLTEMLIFRMPEISAELVMGIIKGIVAGVEDLIAAIKKLFGIKTDEKKKNKASDDMGNWWEGAKDTVSGWFLQGIDYAPATMRVTIHPGEAVVPADRNPNNPGRRGAGGINPPAPLQSSGGGRGGGGAMHLAVIINDKVVDAVTVGAMENGHAPKLSGRIKRASGVVKGYSRGKYTKWS